MTTIPEEIVENTWREVASLAPQDAMRAMEKVAKQQPALLAYVMAETEDYGPDAQELAIYLFFVIVQMFDRLPGHRLQQVSIEQVERLAAENEATLEELEGADERLFERAAAAQITSQPHVLRYLTEALFEEEDPEVELTEDEVGILFLVLKTVIDLLERACKKQHR